MITGTLVNAGAILAGGTVGLLFRQRISEKYIKVVFLAIGLFTLVIGMAMALKTSHFLWMVFSLIIGTLLGTWWNLTQKLESAATRMSPKSGNSDSHKTMEGAITAFLLFCMGSLTILGAFEEGTGGAPNLLFTKSLMDGISSIALAAAFGYGIFYSIPLLLIYQGGLTLLAQQLQNSVPDVVITELTAVGGVILLALGFSILEIKRIAVADLLPALLIIVLIAYLF